MLYEGIEDRLRPWKVDVALLPINGRDQARRVAGNLNGAQAARLAHDINAKLVIPCHYDMFEFNTANARRIHSRSRSVGATIPSLAQWRRTHIGLEAVDGAVSFNEPLLSCFARVQVAVLHAQNTRKALAVNMLEHV